MLIIPAIDIRGGRCVRLMQGDFGRETTFSTDPVAVAVRWKGLGAEMLHVVDLDGAKEGRPANLPLARDIARATGLPVQLGGGLRTREAVEDAFEAGAERVVLGTAAVKDVGLVASLVEKHGDRVVVGIDCRRGQVMAEGWQSRLQTSAAELTARLKDVGVSNFIYTDVERDGMLNGPDLAGIGTLLGLGVKVIASGGISSLDDIRKLRTLEKRGLNGAIIGRAIYDGTVDLRAAIRTASGPAVAGRRHP